MNAPFPIIRERYWLGGGNVAGVLGVSPYKTPLDEYLGIVGARPPDTRDRESFFKRRKSFEPVALEAFTEKTGLDIACVNRRLTDPEHAFIRAELDAETVDGANVEIKTCHPLAARDWGDEGADQCPVYVTAQAMHGLMVSDRQLCYVLAMIGFDDVRVYRIERDDVTIAGMREREVAFWNDHVLAGVPPPATTTSDVLRMFERDSGAVAEASLEMLDQVAELRSLKAECKEVTAAIEGLEERVKLYMADAATLAYQGEVLCSWKSQSCKRLDQKALAAAHPEIVEEFKCVSQSRVFRIR